MINDNDFSRAAELEDEPSGHVTFDDRGNAVWQAWERLDNPNLSLDDTVNHPRANARVNAFGAKCGYNPYDSGVLGKGRQRQKTDLRALSRWIELQKLRGGPKKT